MITWTTERRKLSDLIPWPRNPRKINDAQGKRLAESFDEFGQVETIAIAPNGDILNGHQRLKVLAAKHGKDYTVDVRVASRPLTEKEREKLTVYLHKGAAGEFDMDFLLAEFDMGDLAEWGFDRAELDAFGGVAEDVASAGVDSIPSQWAIMIECDSESAQSELLQRFSDEGLRCKALIS